MNGDIGLMTKEAIEWAMLSLCSTHLESCYILLHNITLEIIANSTVSIIARSAVEDVKMDSIIASCQSHDCGDLYHVIKPHWA